MAQQLSQAIVKQWVALTHGKFYLRDIWAELDIGTPEGKAYLRVIMSRFTEQNIVKSLPDGAYRAVNSDLRVIDWQAADISKTVDLKFPFNLEEYVRIYPKSIIVVAGSKNAGKTAFLYNFIALNMSRTQDEYVIDLYNSETGPEQLKERFVPLAIPDDTIPPFNVFERYDDFAEVIHPDHINVIDYLDMNSDVYLVGAEIDAMFRKLKTGVVVVALQKPPPTVMLVRGVKKTLERDLAYGGAFSAKRSVLYISLSDNRCKLVYAKTPRNPKFHPANMQWSFRIGEDGFTIKDIARYYEPKTEKEWQQTP